MQIAEFKKMSRQILERVSTDWFDLVNQQLDLLREDCLARKDDCAKVPSIATFELAKKTVENLRQLAQFPDLPEPEIWAGVNGEIGIAWEFPSQTTVVELIIADQIFARVFNETEQAGLELSRVPVILSELTKQAAA
jgi:hypothetical protein